MDRRAASGVSATFGAERDGIRIRRAAAKAIPARIPRCELYGVRRGRLPGRWPETHAERDALVLREGPEARRTAALARRAPDLVLVAIGKDRGEPGAAFRLLLAGPDGRPVASDSRSIDHAGFPVLLTGARIRGGEPGTRFVRVEWATGGGSTGTRGEIVARFDLADPRPGITSAVTIMADVEPREAGLRITDLKASLAPGIREVDDRRSR